MLHRLLLLAALPALAGWTGCAGEVVSAVVPTGPALVSTGPTAFTYAVGTVAELPCQVAGLADQSVLWIRSQDLQILSHGDAVFTADPRVTVRSEPVGHGGHTRGPAVTRHVLRIENLRSADSGRYECQINTDPKLSMFFNLTVIDEPVGTVSVWVAGPRRVSAPAGGSVTLACSARVTPAPRRLPPPDLLLTWSKDGQPLDVQSPRGGVSLERSVRPARAEARLTLAALAAADAGTYSCGLPGHNAAAAVQLHVTAHEIVMEAMQRDQAAAGRTPRAAPGALSTLLLTLALALVFIC